MDLESKYEKSKRENEELTKKNDNYNSELIKLKSNNE
jgi:hypothetical protein